MEKLISATDFELAGIQGGDGAYAHEYGQFLGGYIGATTRYGVVTSMPGIGSLIAMGIGLWVAATE